MSTAVISPEEVRQAGQIIPLGTVKEILAQTEPLGDVEFKLDGSSKVELEMPKEWNEDLEATIALPGHALTQCTIKFDETPEPVRLTKDALLKITGLIGLDRKYVLKTPGPLIAVNAKWHLNRGGVRGADSLHLLTKDGYAVATRKDGLASIPNLPLIEEIEETLHSRYGSQELMVDSKFHHDLRRTALRIIVPDSGRVMPSQRSTDDKPDRWSVGLQFINSLMAESEDRTAVSGYLFSWWCANGAITQHGNSGTFNRRSQEQTVENVREWVAAVSAQACEALEPALDDVQELTTVSLEGELNDVLEDVFSSYHLPPKLRPAITEALVDSDDLSAYGLMQAITQSANDPEVSDKVSTTAMSIGGLIPHTITDRCDSCHRVRLG